MAVLQEYTSSIYNYIQKAYIIYYIAEAVAWTCSMRKFVKISKQENTCDQDIFSKIAGLGIQLRKKCLHCGCFSVSFEKNFKTAILQKNFEQSFWNTAITMRINTATW